MAVRTALERETHDDAFKGSSVLCQYTSTGSLPKKWLDEEFRDSLCAGACAGGGGGSVGGNANDRSLGPGEMQLLWPTVEEIRTCDVGYAAGGSIPGNGKNVRRPHLTEKFHKWAKPNDDDDDDAHPMGRRRHMPHIKTFSRYVPAVSAAAVDADPSIGEMKRALQSAMVNIASCVEKSDLRAKYDALTPYQKKRGGGGGVAGAKFAYVIVCSHNLSGAAWGKLEHGGSQIHVYSYELGVMFLPSLIGARTAKPFSALSATEADPFRCLAAVRPRATTTATATATATSEGAVVLTHALTFARPPGAATATTASGPSATLALCPLPYNVPPLRYNLDDNAPLLERDEPWVWDQRYDVADEWGRFGCCG
jgi:tyrosyl-DNA phosphodiesterase-1